TVLLVTTTPWLSHEVTPGPHRYQVRVPPQVEVPLIDSVTVSVPDETEPVPILSGEGAFSCVERRDWHSPSLPRAKSNSVAVIVAEERVSGTNVLKHRGVVPPALLNACVMSIPPSKKSGGTTVLPTPRVASEVSHL